MPPSPPRPLPPASLGAIEAALGYGRGMLRADAIVVLGCRVAPSGRPGPPAKRRAAAAARAFLSGVAPVVVASGGRRWGSQIEARTLRRELVGAGVPEAAVVEELCSLSTYENAIFSAAVLRRLGARQAAIVTCPWHMPRALLDFRAAGVNALALPTGAVDAPLGSRIYLEGHEIVCRWFDARAMRRADILADSVAPRRPEAP
jgi:uncharacterized SAM-binding protein YcdF (DUF218 family)